MTEVVGAVFMRAAHERYLLVGDPRKRRRSGPLCRARRRMAPSDGETGTSGQVMGACAEKPSLPRRQLGAVRRPKNLVRDLRIGKQFWRSSARQASSRGIHWARISSPRSVPGSFHPFRRLRRFHLEDPLGGPAEPRSTCPNLAKFAPRAAAIGGHP